MALPGIIRKIEEIRKKLLPTRDEALVKLSTECVKLSNRVVILELARMSGNCQPTGNITVNNLLGPQGYPFVGGAVIAPLTIVETGDIIPPGAAFVVQVADVSENTSN